MQHLNQIPDFQWTNSTFMQRIGDPCEHDAALGKISWNYARLLHCINHCICGLRQFSSNHRDVDLTHMLFKEKVRLLTSIVSELKGTFRFNTDPNSVEDAFWELQHVCLQTDILYRFSLGTMRHDECINVKLDTLGNSHSTPNGPGIILDPDRLLDIADYICFVGIELEQFFFGIETYPVKAAT